VLNALNVPTARGGRWHASNTRNVMIAASISFPSKAERRERHLSASRKVARLNLTQSAALDAEAAGVQEKLAKPRLGKVQKQSAAILKLYAAGKGPEAIARILGVGEASVYTVLRAAGRGRRVNHKHGPEIEGRRTQILQLRRDERLSAREIAKRLDGVSEAMVYMAVQHAAILRPELAFGRGHLTQDELHEIAELHGQNVPVSALARKLGRSLRTVYRVIERLPDTTAAE
jgi:transposase